MRSDDIHPGDLIGGKYRVRAIVSRIPTLTVEAFHVEFDQRVIIKLLLAGTGDDREIERFRREARVLSKLESEHAARILDVGTQPDGSFYLVRQHVDGEDLGSYVQNYGPRPLPEAVLLALQAAECVAETHSHGIVLRELSPQNTVVTRRPSGTPLLKVTDFGTAKLMRDSAAPAGNSSLTATALFGLSSYSSPELVRKAKNVDQRADIWSLGATLYFMLAGKPPFSGDVTRLMLAITREEPPALTSIRGDVSSDIDNIISWALAKDLDRRFKSVHSFAHALAPYAPAEGQLLIERIAQIAHRSKQRRSGSVPPPPPSYMPPPPSQAGGTLRSSVIPPPPSHPVSIRAREHTEELVGDDEATNVLGGSHLSAMAREITAAIPGLSAPAPIAGMGGKGLAGPQPMGLSARGLPVPPPPPSIPPSPFLPGGPKIVPPRGRQPMPSAPDSQSFSRFDTSPPPMQQSVPPRPPPRRGFDMRIVWGALAASAVMLPVVLLLLLRDPPKGAVAEAPVSVPAGDTKASPAGTQAPTPAEKPANPAEAPIVVTADPTPTANPAPTAEPTGEAPKSPTNAKATPTATTKRDPKAKPEPEKPKPEPEKPKPEPEKPKPEPEASGGGSGRLLAIASGGSCNFSVDGGSKGSGSSLSLSLPAGKHTVVCKPTSGSSKSRGVTIKPNETSMLTFKL